MHITKHLFLLALSAHSHCLATYHLAKMGRLIQCAVPALITTYNVLSGIKDKSKASSELKRYSEPTSRVVEWAQEHVKGVPVLVEKEEDAHQNSEMSYRHPGVITLREDVAWYINQTLEKTSVQQPESNGKQDDNMAFATFALCHEDGHRIYNDISLTKNTTVLLLAQLSAQAMMWKLPLPILHSTKLLPQALFVTKNIACGLIKYAIGSSISGLYGHYKEQRADRFAWRQITSPDVLEGAARYFEKLNQDQLLNILPRAYKHDGSLDSARMLTNFSTWSPSAQKWFTKFANFVNDPTHPGAASRASSLRQAAATLRSRA